jgi:hypothetical protein
MASRRAELPAARRFDDDFGAHRAALAQTAPRGVPARGAGQATTGGHTCLQRRKAAVQRLLSPGDAWRLSSVEVPAPSWYDMAPIEEDEMQPTRGVWLIIPMSLVAGCHYDLSRLRPFPDGGGGAADGASDRPADRSDAAAGNGGDAMPERPPFPPRPALAPLPANTVARSSLVA